MTLEPDNADHLRGLLLDCLKNKSRVSSMRLHKMDACLDHNAGDMTATFEAGISLEKVQTILAKKGQWLPIDPFPSHNDSLGAHLAANRFGPRRHAYGTLKDYLIGVRVMLPNGEIVGSGGKVVKNVAGFDLCKLFVGSQGSLGVICEATFKLLPIPEKEILLTRRCSSLEEAGQLIEIIVSSKLSTACLDIIHREKETTLLTGFAGMKEDVDWQVQTLSRMDSTRFKPCETGIHALWTALGIATHQGSATLPSRVIDHVYQNQITTCWIHAGIGFVRHEGMIERKPNHPALVRRIRDAFDPHRIMSDPDFMPAE